MPHDDAIGTRIGPTFKTNSGAEMYAAFLNGEGQLNWDVTASGCPCDRVIEATSRASRLDRSRRMGLILEKCKRSSLP